MKITKSTRRISAANLGEADKYPEFSFQKPGIKIFPFDNLKASDREGIFTEGKQVCMPYTPQAGYDRNRTVRDIPTIEIENDFLKGIFYPELGGRLASLYDKKANRELLFDNSVFQPANLAIRNAWFSGGVEWNGPIYGHNLLTCSSVYFAQCVDSEEENFLRIYEFDRVTSTAWQVDFKLDNDKLWIHCSAFNPESVDKRFYWWTNIAAPIVKGTRVFASESEEVIHHNPKQEIVRSSWPDYNGFDASYPEQHPHSNGLFFDTLDEKRPWIAVCDAEGKGLVHTSTKNLMGRKFFVWGANQGGKRWESFLSEDNKGAYLEIQAGITPTQVQTTHFPGKSQISWTECISSLSVSPEKAHDANWFSAKNYIEAGLSESFLSEKVDDVHKAMSKNQKCKPCEILHTGSAWGEIFQKSTGTQISKGMVFRSQPTKAEKVWLDFLETATMTEGSPEDPKDFVCSDYWIGELERSEQNYLTKLHLGIAHLQNEDFDKADELFKSSIELCDTSFARRCIAIILSEKDDNVAALDEYVKAFELSNKNEGLAQEIVLFMKDKGFTGELVEFIGELEKPMAKLPERIQLTLAQVYLAEGKFNEAEELILNREYATIREGESILSDMWYEIKERQGITDPGKLPLKIDFSVL